MAQINQSINDANQIADELQQYVGMDDGYPLENAIVDADGHINSSRGGSQHLMNVLHGAQNDAEHNIRLAKARKERTRVQNFVADICGVDPDKKMTKLNTLGSVIWMGAKFSIASAIFGPIVGGWMVAHMANHSYYSENETGIITLANSLLFDNLMTAPKKDDYKHLSPRHKEEASK